MAMQFLNLDDFGSQVTDTLLQGIISNNIALLEKAVTMSISEAGSYLNSRFDVPAIFAAEGNERSPLIIMFLVDMAIYHLHARVSPRNISELRVTRYNNAIDWFQMAASGALMPDLPIKKDESGNADNRLKWGSNPKPNLRF